MTKKDIINKIKKEFKGKATENGRRCKYLTVDGKKCAIGLFIPKGHEAQRSNASINVLIGEYPELSLYMPSKNRTFLFKFQSSHDNLNLSNSINKQKQVLIDWINENYEKYNHEVECG